MDLAELLTREGYIPTDVPALMSWAHDRAGALIAELDDASPLRELLAGRSGQVLADIPRPALAREPAPAHEPAPASKPPASRPPSSLTVELSEVEEDAPIDLRSAVAAATKPHPIAQEPDDPDSGFGGFVRFGGIARMNRPYPIREETQTDERPAIVRGFITERETRAEERPVEKKPPPSTTGELSSALPVATLDMSAEESGGLVLGIPDEESADVPVPRLGSNSVPNRRFVVSEPEPATGLSDSSVALASLTESFDPAADSGEFISPAPAARPVAQTPVGVDLRQPIPVSRREQTGPREAAAATSEDPSDPQAPVIRHRNPKKKVVELGAPVARPHGVSATAKVVPRPEPSSRHPRKTPPPPPGQTRRTPPPMIDEDIQELSRVEVLDELPAYLRDDED